MIDRLRVRKRTAPLGGVEMAMKLSEGFVLLVSEGAGSGTCREIHLPRLRDKPSGDRTRLFSFNNPTVPVPTVPDWAYTSTF